MSSVALIASAAGLGYVLTRGDGDGEVSKPITARESIKALGSRYQTNAPSQYGIYDPLVDRRDVESMEIRDKVLARVKKEYDALTGAAKEKVCKELKAQWPDSNQIQSLDCKAGNWENLFAAAGSVAGAAGGSALCGPPCAYVGGVLGGAVGKVIGKEVGEFFEDAYDEIESVVGDAYDAAADVVDDLLDAVW